MDLKAVSVTAVLTRCRLAVQHSSLRIVLRAVWCIANSLSLLPLRSVQHYELSLTDRAILIQCL